MIIYLLTCLSILLCLSYLCIICLPNNLFLPIYLDLIWEPYLWEMSTNSLHLQDQTTLGHRRLPYLEFPNLSRSPFYLLVLKTVPTFLRDCF